MLKLKIFFASIIGGTLLAMMFLFLGLFLGVYFIFADLEKCLKILDSTKAYLTKIEEIVS
jgi:hypothetical protein